MSFSLSIKQLLNVDDFNIYFAVEVLTRMRAQIYFTVSVFLHFESHFNIKWPESYFWYIWYSTQIFFFLYIYQIPCRLEMWLKPDHRTAAVVSLNSCELQWIQMVTVYMEGKRSVTTNSGFIVLFCSFCCTNFQLYPITVQLLNFSLSSESRLHFHFLCNTW